jgi:5'-deoxynucleotidase YfbR-like HD superfamily hydrolase
MDTQVPPIDRLAELQQLIADFADVLRAVPLMNKGRRENDVDHSFGLAITCWYLAPKIAPNLSLEKILQYALAHDFVEIYSGDAFAFDAQAVSKKDGKETEALRELRTEWPDFQELSAAAEAYKNKADPEARFVYTIDKILPAIMVKIGEDETFWKRHKITREAHEQEKKNKMQYSPEALPYLDLLNKWAAEPDNFYTS